MFMKNKLNPPGCNPPRHDDRIPVVQVVSGDTWEIQARLFAADGGPASPDNSHVEFVLSENQFSPPLWTGVWYTGILPYENRAGYVRVVIPRDLTKTLRRGSYQFSLRVSDRLRRTYNTQLVGHFLVEYAPTSDQHSIPYRDGTSEIFVFRDDQADGIEKSVELIEAFKRSLSDPSSIKLSPASIKQYLQDFYDKFKKCCYDAGLEDVISKIGDPRSVKLSSASIVEYLNLLYDKIKRK